MVTCLVWAAVLVLLALLVTVVLWSLVLAALPLWPPLLVALATVQVLTRLRVPRPFTLGLAGISVLALAIDLPVGFANYAHALGVLGYTGSFGGVLGARLTDLPSLLWLSLPFCLLSGTAAGSSLVAVLAGAARPLVLRSALPVLSASPARRDLGGQPRPMDVSPGRLSKSATLAPLSSGDSSLVPAERPSVRLSGPVIELDLGRHLAEIRAGGAYRDADHAAETLVKEAGLCVVLIALKDGGRLSEHRAHTSITVQVVEGMVRFAVDGRTIELTPGRVLVVDSDLPHHVQAVGESALLLTMGGS